jgi:integrase
MAIRKLYNGHYQARLEGADGKYLTRVCRTKGEAEEQERKWKQEKRDGMIGTVADRHVTVDEFFQSWFKTLKDSSSEEEKSGWRDIQGQLYLTFVFPVIGSFKLRAITPQHIKEVLGEMARAGKAEQTRRHVYAMLRKMFGDAIEDYQCLTFNPALKKLKPDVHTAEAPHLQNLEQICRLLRGSEGRFFELAVWVQIYAGLRIGEVEALRWEDVDLETGTLSVRRAFVRQTNKIRNYPKGKKQFTLSLPPELWQKLRQAQSNAKGEFVATSSTGVMLQYKYYLKGLRELCDELGLPHLGTHGLRHTTSSIYRQHGASKEDMRELFAHSSGAVTERYLHGEGSNLQRVAKQIRLFGEQTDTNPPTSPEPNKNRTKLRLVRCS